MLYNIKPLDSLGGGDILSAEVVTYEKPRGASGRILAL